MNNKERFSIFSKGFAKLLGFLIALIVGAGAISYGTSVGEHIYTITGATIVVAAIVAKIVHVWKGN